MPQRYRPFDYLPKLECFVINADYEAVARYLGLVEWHPAVWLGRYFSLDNDFGEHWFDNWEQRSHRREQAAALGYDETDLFIIDPLRHRDGRDGPCHSDALRARFWHDVLTSFTISLDMLIAEARHNKAELERRGLEAEEEYVPDLEQRILYLTSQS